MSGSEQDNHQPCGPASSPCTSKSMRARSPFAACAFETVVKKRTSLHCQSACLQFAAQQSNCRADAAFVLYAATPPRQRGFGFSIRGPGPTTMPWSALHFAACNLRSPCTTSARQRRTTPRPWPPSSVQQGRADASEPAGAKHCPPRQGRCGGRAQGLGGRGAFASSAA